MHEKVNCMAITATATSSTKEIVCNTLGLIKPFLVTKSPNRPNIFYSVLVKPQSFESVFGKMNQTVTDRVLIYCKSYDDVGDIYQWFRYHLGEEGYEPKERLLTHQHAPG